MEAAAGHFWKIKLAAAGKPLLHGSQGTVSPALLDHPHWEGKKLCFWASKLLLWKQAGAVKSIQENNLCCSGFPHLKRSLGWVRSSEGWFSPWTEPLLLFYTVARKGLSFKGGLDYKHLHRSLLRKKVWGVCFSLFILNPQQISPVTVSPRLARPVLRTPSPAGMRNNLLVPDVLQCPWGFQDTTGISPVFYLNNFHTFPIRTRTPTNSLKGLAKTLPSTPPFPPPDPQPLPISPWAAGENWFSGGM